MKTSIYTLMVSGFALSLSGCCVFTGTCDKSPKSSTQAITKPTPQQTPSHTGNQTNHTAGNTSNQANQTNNTTSNKANQTTNNTTNNTANHTTGNTNSNANQTANNQTASNQTNNTNHQTTKTTKAMSFIGTLAELGADKPRSQKVARPDGKIAAEIRQAIANTNKLRAEKGLPALKYDASLSAYAQLRANEISQVFSHNRPNGESYAVVISGGSGENIAAGKSTADETVLQQWRNSQGHYQNMINNRYTSIGIGMAYIPNSKYGYYWVQIFGFAGTTAPYAFDDSQHHSHNPNNPKPLEYVTLNGTAMALPLNPKGNWHTLPNDMGVSNGYDHVRFGAIKNHAVSDVSVFYQGEQTASHLMPKAGTAQYKGKAVLVHNDQIKPNAHVQFLVDFDQKTLNGTLEQNGQPLLTLAGDIRGNAFSSPSHASTQMQGAFFGEKGEELGGVFKDKPSGQKGAFGAVKSP